MANWGQPDFDPNEVIDYDTLWAKVKAEGGITEWPHKGPAGFDHATVRRYCVDTRYDEVVLWQRIRLSMKGKPTHIKLDILLGWWNLHTVEFDKATLRIDAHSVHVQVYNYLGALRRGGQLNSHNQIRKYI